MKVTKEVIGAAIFTLIHGMVGAAPGEDEIRRLGTTLTPMGAEKAGNKDGTIPEYTGGLTKAPASYDKKRPGVRTDPFPDDKPLFRIDAKNMDKYADKLSPGVKEMMKKYPTFFIEVYPSRRTAAFPKSVLDHTIKNASRCATANGDLGLDTSKGCGYGFPFPIPKNGLEAMWNHDARYIGDAYVTKTTGTYVKPSGEVVLTNQSYMHVEIPWYDDSQKTPNQTYLIRAEYFGPARIAGQSTLFYDMAADSERRSWSYQPATRRVRLAPDLAADTPISIAGGAMVYDEGNQFSGKKDRYEWTLVGKQEMFIPYNAYKYGTRDKASGCSKEALLTPYHAKPGCLRWELHRVWHVTGTLKAGKRHIYGKRDMFFDEDTWYGGLAENYDQSGRLYRENFIALTPSYDIPAPGLGEQITHDLVSGIYYTSMSSDGYVPTKRLSADQKTADSMTTHILKY